MQVHDHVTGVTGAELRTFGFHVLGSAPGTGNFAGRFYWDSGLLAPRWWDGAGWTNKATDSEALGGQTLAQVRARSSHTGTQTASTISDFDTQVRTSRLDQMAAPTAAVSFNGQRATGGGTPTAGTDFTTKDYVDATSAGRDWKDSVRVATTANITLSGTQTIDGVAVIAGDRVLVKDQTTGSQNGIYVVAAGAWARSTDADTNAEVNAGMTVPVEEGTANGDRRFILTTNNPITLGTTALSFTADAGESITGGAGLTKTGSTLDVVAGTTPASGGPGGGIVVNADSIVIDTGVVARRGVALLSTSATSYTIPHGIGHADLNSVVVRNVSTGELEYPRIVVDATNIVVTFLVAPAANAYRVAWSG